MLLGVRKNKGFTIIETLVVISSLVILVGISAGVYISFLRRSYVDVNAREIQSVLNLAKVRTVSSEGPQSFGVHFDPTSNEYTLFPGSSYDPLNANNEVFRIDPTVTISSVDINGGGNDVIFERLIGSTSQYGSITLQDIRTSPSQSQICISESAVVEIQASCAQSSLEYTQGTIDASIADFPSNTGHGDPAQSFTTDAGSGTYARATDLYLKKASASPSNVFLELRSLSTVGPVIGRSWTINSSNLGSSYEWVRFVFPSPVPLSAGTQYFIRLRSLPDSAVASSGAEGLIHWGYEHSSSSPPAYALGDAWRYVNEGNIPTYAGQRLGPSDQYDFSFKIIYGVGPPLLTDSRHMDFDLEDLNEKGWSIQSATTLRLEFSDPPNPDVIQDLSMACCFNASSTEFDWQGNIDVNGDTETLRIHTHYLDSNDTVLSVHRDRRFNEKALIIYIDGKDIVSYTANGTTTVGAYGGNMIHR